MTPLESDFHAAMLITYDVAKTHGCRRPVIVGEMHCPTYFG